MAARKLKTPASAPQPLSQQMRSWLYSNPLYQLTLSYDRPAQLAVPPQDVWPGHADHGQAFSRGYVYGASQTIHCPEPNWSPGGASRSWQYAVHSFGWLRDLKVLGGDHARRQARKWVGDWVEKFRHWDAIAWDPAVMGQRLTHWLLLHDFFCASADDAFRFAVYDSIAQQSSHLLRILPDGLRGLPLLQSCHGATLAALALQLPTEQIDFILKLYRREISQQMLADGGHISRSPLYLFRILQQLIELRSALHHAKIPVPDEFTRALERGIPLLKFFRHGDHGLAQFYGAVEGENLLIDAVIGKANAQNSTLKTAPQSGYERLQLGRTLVIIDCKGAPSQPDASTHASTFAFELSMGRERLVVNCGHYHAQGAWAPLLAGSSAHSTVVVNDTNIFPLVYFEGTRRNKRRHCTANGWRDDPSDRILFEGHHDGYRENYGITHRRRLVLDTGGDQLVGEDFIKGGAKSLPYSVRFHLHPTVQASLTQDGQTVLLKLPSGNGWRFKAYHGQLSLEQSIYFNHEQQARRSWQIVLTGQTQPPETVIGWYFRRERK